MKKNILLCIYLLFCSLLFSQNFIPKLFQLEWGLNFEQVQNQISKSDIGLGKLNYYSILQGRDLNTDLMTSASVKFNAKGSPFFGIPAEVIFTFYNPSRNINYLQLSKIEIYLSRKDNNDIWVDAKQVYKDLLKIFIKNYDIELNYTLNKNIYSNYDFQITINGIYVNFIANVNTNNAIIKDKSLYINYENNQFQSMILKKEIDLLEQTNKKEGVNEENNLNKIRSNL
jgi:hypothetical protein